LSRKLALKVLLLTLVFERTGVKSRTFNAGYNAVSLPTTPEMSRLPETAGRLEDPPDRPKIVELDNYTGIMHSGQGINMLKWIRYITCCCINFSMLFTSCRI